MSEIAVKRVYDPPEKGDGKRILVDRLWPRGIAKETAPWDLWLKEVAPSPDLRKWFGHEPAKWGEFQARYRAELEAAQSDAKAGLAMLRAEAKKGKITLLSAARNREQNSAVLLRAFLLGRQE
ncbi:Uncharacterized conserved protein YeaO, DUF488 family [Chelatococcus sambhunathii]|uniref:Uncharacterized conserved protein YeaO, DUF488 family n=1 Tax=Chelatococcus sambhunathii TaxID=363953 RepID=A0ABM9UC14_9HYPH|nr:DUF488 domain-containing protein [Chelatococcus sambhunathii]CUA89725.1 Uncharacterized conserved protein YeaO, DUF488 family [Chelatococcus sambhunathii]